MNQGIPTPSDKADKTLDSEALRLFMALDRSKRSAILTLLRDGQEGLQMDSADMAIQRILTHGYNVKALVASALDWAINQPIQAVNDGEVGIGDVIQLVSMALTEAKTLIEIADNATIGNKGLAV